MGYRDLAYCELCNQIVNTVETDEGFECGVCDAEITYMQLGMHLEEEYDSGATSFSYLDRD